MKLFGCLVKSPYFCTRFRERNPGARVQTENYINEEDRKIRYSVLFLWLYIMRGEKFKKSQLLKKNRNDKQPD